MFDANCRFIGKSYLLKILNQELTGFKMSTVSAGDVVRVDIFKNKNAAELVKLYYFFVNELIERGVLEEINE